MSNSKTKIVIIGAGNVGEAIGYTLMLRKQASDIVMIDVNEARAQGSALDILHGTAYLHEVTVRFGEYSECANADVIIVTAGVARKSGQTRLELAKVNLGIAKSVSENIMKYAKNPFIIVVANPVDLMTYAITKITGLPASRVVGTGTTLDTARFRCILGEICNVNVCDVSGYICGEHGDSQVALWSGITLGGEPLDQFLTHAGIQNIDRDAIETKVKKSGADIISKKGATFYGVASATSRVVEAYLEDQRAVLPVSHVISSGFPGLEGVSFSLPCIIDGTGLVRIIPVSMNEEERKKLVSAAARLRTFTEEAMQNLNHNV